MDPCQIREFQHADLDAVLELEAEAFPEEAYSRWIFFEYYWRSPDLFLVATVGDRLAAYAIGDTGTAEDRARLVSIAVGAPHRRTGIGRALCEELFSRLERSGSRFVDLETRCDNDPAIRLWRSLGFTPTGTIRGYYGDVDALTMGRPLRPSEVGEG